MSTSNRFALITLIFLLLTVFNGYILAHSLSEPSDEEQMACDKECFPFVARIRTETCQCADLDGSWHNHNW